MSTILTTPQCINYHVVIPAGGTGLRMQEIGHSIAKQFMRITDKTVLEHAVDAFVQDTDCVSIYIAVADSQITFTESLFSNSKIHVVRGGKTRSQSVLAGLNALHSTSKLNSWVMVHDAARPNLYLSDVEKLKAAVSKEPYGGILASPAKDTLKKTDGKNVLETLDRKTIWHALTPQMFRIGKLFSALNQAILDGIEITDEASAMEYMGAKVLLVEGRKDNFKLTHPEELQLLRNLLRARL